MSTESNKEILLRLDAKFDALNREVANMKFDFGQQISNLKNANDKRFRAIESYMHSDPKTNQAGAIEKLNQLALDVVQIKTESKIEAERAGGQSGKKNAGIVTVILVTIYELLMYFGSKGL